MKRIGFIDGRRIRGFTLSGAVALDGQRLDISDVIEVASGTTRGVYINYTQSGTKTGSAQVNALAVDMGIAADVPYAYGISISLDTIDDKTVGFLSGLSIYWEDYGDALTHSVMIDLGKNSVHEPADRNCFFRCREHTTVWPNSSVMRLEGGNSSGYFVVFDNPAGAEDAEVILDAATCGESADYRIRCHLEHYAIDRYIYLFPV